MVTVKLAINCLLRLCFARTNHGVVRRLVVTTIEQLRLVLLYYSLLVIAVTHRRVVNSFYVPLLLGFPNNCLPIRVGIC